ncbi:DUF481 domain-containing protein [Thiocapsa imhoffii]|nr:DUF481 domain-containing protein [Thiocapsa imhoffii]
MAPPVLRADTLIMVNGDRLSGRLLQQGGDYLVLETAYAGILEIDLDQVREIQRDHSLDLRPTHGRALAVSESAGQEPVGQLQSAPPTTQPLDAEVVHEVAAGGLLEGALAGDLRLFTGALNVALVSDRGNSHTNELYLDYHFETTRGRGNLSSRGQFEYETSRRQTLTDQWLIFNKYTYDLRDPWYASAWLQLNMDRFADLRLRTVIGPAMGYRLFAQDDLNLSVELGTVYIDERYNDNPRQEHWGLGLSLEYDQLVWQERLQLYHRQRTFVSWGGTGQDLIYTWTGVRVPLMGGFVGSLEFQIEYDSRPVDDVLTTDTTLLLKLGYQW